ncbi:MAG: S46 family peptidase [Bacteroidaceae bacterium]|nr:S46 family peptidase [Bacteroidaceae bacterium]
MQNKLFTSLRALAVAAVVALAPTAARADGGMWLLKLMEQQHLADSLRAAGLEIDPSEVYNENGLSLKDVVGIFGNGCTGEIVSPDGLIFTNNHCGFDFVHKMSTLEHNYLQDGFYAKSRAEELPTPGLDFVFVRSIEDVTDIVLQITEGMSEYIRQNEEVLAMFSGAVLERSQYKDVPGIRVRIVPYFGGNQFYAFYEQVYNDVRLVVNIPQNFAQFGENQDNWMWPRHNPDAAVFRVYADRDGNPADYDPANVPLHCDKYLPISMRGVEAGDFAMVMGFPGTTERYLTASEVENHVGSLNSPINVMGEVVLAHMKGLMDNDSALNLSMASDYFMMGNTVKNFGGQIEAVRKVKLVERKRAAERDFLVWALQNGHTDMPQVLGRIDQLEREYADTVHDLYLSSFGTRQLAMKPPYYDVASYVENFREIKKLKMVDSAQLAILEDATFLTPEEVERDKALAKQVFRTYLKHKRLPANFLPISSPAEVDAYVDNLYDNSVLTDSARLVAFLKKPSQKVLDADPWYQYRQGFTTHMMTLASNIEDYEAELTELNKKYIAAQLERNGWTTAPDANFTLRMTYGHVCDLRPRDGVTYDYQTVIDGMFEKENPADPDYVINEDVRALYEAGDFGRYARPDGKLPACFITDNDITGGNSGSPVMNARGELIGLAFDGNIESLSSDLEYNGDLQRCITVDIRYVLWCIDKLAKSTYLFDELDLRF